MTSHDLRVTESTESGVTTATARVTAEMDEATPGGDKRTSDVAEPHGTDASRLDKASDDE